MTGEGGVGMMSRAPQQKWLPTLMLPVPPKNMGKNGVGKGGWIAIPGSSFEYK